MFIRQASAIPDASACGGELPPGPRGLAAVRAAIEFARDPWNAPARLRDRYGDVVSVPVPSARLVLLSHPDDLAHVAVRHSDQYQRANMVGKEMPRGDRKARFFAFERDEDEWSRGRKLLQPHFSPKELTLLDERFTGVITEQVESWRAYAETGKTVELHYQLKAATIATLFSAMFAVNLTDERTAWMIEQLQTSMNATTVGTLLSWLPRSIPRPLAQRGLRAEHDTKAFIDSMVAERRASPTEDAGDILTTLLNATYDDGTPLTDAKVRAEVSGLIVGGFETTAAALAWTFALVAQHPEARDRLVAEVDALGEERITPRQMAKLPFARACFDEAQRLQGGLVINPKTATVDDEIGGYRIPAGTTVISSNFTVHRDPRFWPDPDRFDPERWLRDDVRREAFWPFGRGSRMCLGMRMAYIEAVLILAAAYRRYDFALPAGFKIRPHYRMSVGIKGGVPMTITART